jgi:hypothetical protein
VIELHLIGYTADLEVLVLDHGPDGEGAFTLAVDPDLLATLEQLLTARAAAEAEAGATDGAVAHEATVGEADPAVALRDRAAEEHGRLSPAEIQTLLRAGRSVRAVAKEAGTDVAWVERWLAPIVAERDRVLREARAVRVGGGRGRRSFGELVERRLVERGGDPSAARWEAVRRTDGRWRVTVRFDERGRSRSATWGYDRDEQALRPQSPLASELADGAEPAGAAAGRRPSKRS